MDLFRINGGRLQYVELLEAAGVDTVIELSRQVPENLVQMMVALNTEYKKVHQLPILAQAESWVEQVQQLPKAINY